MSGGIEAAGDIATGALLGRAVEPHAGEHGSGDGVHVCLNCGTALIGGYCHACGQSAHVRRTIGSIGHDLLHGVFHFEGKIWRTLPLLALHPGDLTRRYIAGERARFVSPLALFLFAVFLLFAVIHSLAGDFDTGNLTPAEREESVAKLDSKIAAIDARVSRAKTAPAGDKIAPDDLAALMGTKKALMKARDAVAAGRPPGVAIDFDNRQTGWAPLDRGIARARADPSLAIYKLQASAYKYSWALIPISVPFVALLFVWKRRFTLYDHTIFVIYSLDFMTLLIVAVSLLAAIGVAGGITDSLIAFAPPAHLYRQLRGAYGLRRFSAIWRTAALLIFAFVALVLFAALLLGMGLME